MSVVMTAAGHGDPAPMVCLENTHKSSNLEDKDGGAPSI